MSETEPTNETGTTETDDVVEEAAPAEAAAPAPAPTPVESDTAAESADRNVRKVREGTVVSDTMDKTAVVAVIERVRHPRYNKFVQRTKKLYVHDETNDANVGDKVRVMETRPLSKTKRWRVVEIVERAK